MKEYEIIAFTTSVLKTTVKANSQEEAENLAVSIDGGEFEEVSSDWTIDEVREVN